MGLADQDYGNWENLGHPLCSILCRVTLKTNLINTSPLSGTVLKSAKGELEFIKKFRGNNPIFVL